MNTAKNSATVAIVVSTYNGERHIEDQIDSLLRQTWSKCSIFVRDDGSSDATVQLLKSYEMRGLIHLKQGQNIGVVNSFFECIQSVPPHYDYIALCDQDDIWHDNKIERALEVLSEVDNGVPLLYCSELFFCDEQIESGHLSHLNRRGVDFQHMLYETVCFGNTMVFNRELAYIATAHGTTDVVSHDWWIALVASAVGAVIFDPEAHINYRRTGANVSAAGKSWAQLFIFRIRNFLLGNQMQAIDKQLCKLQDSYGERLSPHNQILLGRFCNGGRIAKAFFPKSLRQKGMDDLFLRLLFLLGR